ncbi:regulatory iron-sulfur-containing complex subunit RicT [Treponema brennaborense]|uniref:PSP1 domain protein n=1 Tax=Treponema brennaborense (strain DSM 12168 / CIP 105900 / DD5/3) TaxID=906968 RepID=F4LM87_TREBD|nr:regulatory iron-sulfur-containing complex subunit RicT [Treponema brennaborense]AEE17753.1 PSP1 domain protein [Treponema brennaborense DSM 12168]
MSELFENDIENLSGEDLAALEDTDVVEETSDGTENLIYPEPLYRLKLEYSCEGVYAAVPDGMTLENGEYVIIPTRYGKDLARVLGKVSHPIGIRTSDIITVDRKTNAADLARAEELKEKEKQAFKIFQEKVLNHKLDMKLIATHYLLEEQKILFFFSAEKRVDFRELVKDLVSVFKMRIELRQIGVRDESRITGGLGVCGRPYCCHAVSDKLRPVSIRMAKDQNLSLNSMKISGQCGRLLCCLSYEYDWYTEARKKLPNEGLRIFYDGTNFRVSEVNPLNGLVKMSGEDGRLLEIAGTRFVQQDGRWKIN